mgnify:CR=1 FL=1
MSKAKQNKPREEKKKSKTNLLDRFNARVRGLHALRARVEAHEGALHAGGLHSLHQLRGVLADAVAAAGEQARRRP